MIAVSEEYSLDDFVPNDDGAGDPNDDGADDQVDDGANDSVDDVEPAVATSCWSSDGETCPDCGSTASRLWRHEERFVCADCKEW